MQHRLSTVKHIPLQSLGKRTLVLVGIGLALLGLVLGTIGGMWWLKTRNFVQSAEHAEGTVIELVEKRSTKTENNRTRTSITYSPVVEFSDYQEQRHEFHGTSSSPPRYSVGDKVSVLYDRDHPNSASIDHWLDLYLGQFIIGVIAAGCLFFAMVFFITGLGKSKNQEIIAEEEPASL